MLTQTSISAALAATQNLGLERLDAQLLLLHALGKQASERVWLLAHDDEILSDELADAFRALSLRRAAGEPLAYIVGYKEFFGLQFAVDARVLVPRPDTETLVQWALDVLQGMTAPQILDLGTGSGAVAIAIAHRLKAKVTATDFSESALCMATQNAQRLGTDVQFFQSNWLENDLFSGRGALCCFFVF